MPIQRSKESDLKHYEVRGVACDNCAADDEATLATIPFGASRELLTSFGLTHAGLTAGFKVYVVLNSGNERGSEAVYVTRPA